VFFGKEGVGYHGSRAASEQYVKVRGGNSSITTKIENLEKGDLLFLESPRNPNCIIMDLEELSEKAKSVGAMTVLDATFATPILIKGLSHGIDFVLHSCSKFLGGHSDCLAGVVVTKREIDAAKLFRFRTTNGAVLGSLECFLLLRSLRSLSVRMERHARNAQEVAEWLEKEEMVERVDNPCLPSHPSHELWKKYFNLAPPCFSFVMKEEGWARHMPNQTELFFNSTSSLVGVLLVF